MLKTVISSLVLAFLSQTAFAEEQEVLSSSAAEVSTPAPSAAQQVNPYAPRYKVYGNQITTKEGSRAEVDAHLASENARIEEMRRARQAEDHYSRDVEFGYYYGDRASYDQYRDRYRDPYCDDYYYDHRYGRHHGFSKRGHYPHTDDYGPWHPDWRPSHPDEVYPGDDYRPRHRPGAHYPPHNMIDPGFSQPHPRYHHRRHGTNVIYD